MLAGDVLERAGLEDLRGLGDDRVAGCVIDPVGSGYQRLGRLHDLFGRPLSRRNHRAQVGAGVKDALARAVFRFGVGNDAL